MKNLIRLIVIAVPPKPVADAITWFREPLCREYNDSWALSYPPHVTLRTGVLVPEREIGAFIHEFGETIDGQGSFMIQTDKVRVDTSVYEGQEKAFVYLPVIKDAGLFLLNRRLLTYTRYRKSPKQEFEPHVTLFLGNVPPEKIGDMKAQIANKATAFNFPWAWCCDNVSLYIKKNASWEPFHIFPLP